MYRVAVALAASKLDFSTFISLPTGEKHSEAHSKVQPFLLIVTVETASTPAEAREEAEKHAKKQVQAIHPDRTIEATSLII